jgi:catechol 2,3-dioxygenase-like lactoylglutathione lyase family enzyme
MAIGGVNHTSFTVSSLDRSIAFYQDVLGLELVTTIERRAPWIAVMTGLDGARLRIAALRSPGTEHVVELVEYEQPRGEQLTLPTNAVGCAHLGFVVDDIDAEYRRLRDAGVEFVSPPVRVTEPPSVGTRAAYFRDPDGIPLELQERSE